MPEAIENDPLPEKKIIHKDEMKQIETFVQNRHCRGDKVQIFIVLNGPFQFPLPRHATINMEISQERWLWVASEPETEKIEKKSVHATEPNDR